LFVGVLHENADPLIVVHSKVDDKYYILELNDTAIGLVHDHEEEDMQYMRDLVTLRMQEKFPKSNPKSDLGLVASTTENVGALTETIKLLEIQVQREQQKQQQLEKKLADKDNQLLALSNTSYLRDMFSPYAMHCAVLESGFRCFLLVFIVTVRGKGMVSR